MKKGELISASPASYGAAERSLDSHAARAARALVLKLMKQSDSTEMDRLLRRYARRNAETLPAGGDGQSGSTDDRSTGAHMDADELNAYAEGALPENARARYFAHLADCDSCRKLVTELTLAAGIVSEEKRVAVAGPAPRKSWREWLAAIFSPPVLRYAVPALALFGVIIVAVVVMRARREDSLVAQDNEATRNTALRTPANEESGGTATSANINAEATNHTNGNIANSNIASAPTQASSTPANGGIAAPEQEKPAVTEQDAPLPKTPLADATKPAVGQTELDDKRGVFRTENRSSDTVAGAPAPQPTPVLAAAAPPPAPPVADGNAAKREEQKQKNQPKDEDEVVTVDRTGPGTTASKTAANEARRDRGRKASEPTSPSTGGMAIIAPKSEAGGAKADKERSAETRSVGGRQFHRQGNAWVDTAYNSSRSTINVPRGSEQYRALIADEPELRTITQQLGGEVIVVWKSRAYRFY